MSWYDGATFQKISDHNRAPIDIEFERIGSDHQTADGTLRRWTVAKKRTFSTSWEMLPSTNTKSAQGGMTTADLGWAGESMENFYNTTDGAFQVQFRRGDGTTETVTCMITDFSKSVVKRGPRVDFWNLSVTLREV